MSGPPHVSKSSSSTDSVAWTPEEKNQWEYKDCLSCRVIGTGALGLTGLYALGMARPKAPGSVFGKMMMAGIGFGSVVRWNMTPTQMLGAFTDQVRGVPRRSGS
ncbi:hypothetical protein JVU11DRAFT_8338 [Chiua virens]|nr:hypothetical protein JVU11DRAFT_8338 [Chiua virens]